MLHRINYFPDLETRAKERIIRGISVPFDSPTYIRSPIEGEFWEEFPRGAFARSINNNPKGFTFNILHDRRTRLPIGVSVETREDAKGLYQEFRVSDTEAGNEVLALARDGVPLGLSIGFAPVNDHWSADKSRVWRKVAELKETSVVNEPAYSEAQVIGVRDAFRYGNLEETVERTESAEEPAADMPPEPSADESPSPDTAEAVPELSDREQRLQEVEKFKNRLDRLEQSLGRRTDG